MLPRLVLTFFPNDVNQSWTDNAPVVAADGGLHTYSQLLDITNAKRLQTVTVADAFSER